MQDKHWRALSYVLFISVAIVMLATFTDYGTTADEEVQRRYGDYLLLWYASGFTDHSAFGFLNTYLYGGFFEIAAQLASRISPFGLYETRHLANVLCGVLGIAAASKIASHVAGSAAGFFAALFLALTPVFYGHSFNNPKDIPFAAFFTLSLFYIIVSYDYLPRVPKRLLAKLTLAIGLTLGVRIGGILLFGYLALLWTAWLLIKVWLETPADKFFTRAFVSLVLSYFTIVLFAWATMLICWPWGQVSPFFNPIIAIKETAQFKWTLTNFFEGQYVPATALPWTYLPKWFAISLPEFYFLSLAADLYLAYKFFKSFRPTPVHFERLVKVGSLVFVFCFPILTAILLHSTLYDAMRQFLFILPALSALAGISFAGLLKSDATRFVRAGIAALAFISVGLTVYDMVDLHPYQTIYFNRVIAGGLKSASARFETDYWGNAYREGAEWVTQNYPPNAQGQVRVATCTSSFMTDYFFAKTEAGRRFVTVPTDKDPQLFIAGTRFGCHKTKQGRVLHIVERKGTPLLYIIELQNQH